MMSLAEYTEAVKNGLRERLKAAPRQDREKYIMTLEKKGYIKESYEQDIDKEVAELTGMSGKPNPASFCYAAALQYPELPAR